MKFSKEYKVGLLAVVACVILYFGVRFLKGSDFLSTTNTYYAIYDEIDGLTVSNQVLINGLSVGRVSDISIMQNNGNKLLVAMDIESDIVLGDSTVALLFNSDLLGSKAISLNVGAISRPLNDEDTLIARIDEGFTEAIQKTAMPIIDNIDSAFSNINVLLANLNSNNAAINSIFAKFDSAATGLQGLVNENRRNLSGILGDMNKLTAALSDTENGLEPFLAKMNSLADSLNDLELKQTVAEANVAMANLREITEKINDGNGSLGKLMNNDSLYDNFNQSARDLDRLLIDIRENPNRYIHFSVFGRKDKGSSEDEPKGLK